MSKQEKAAAAASLTDLKQLRKALAAFAGEQAAQRKAEEQARQLALRQAERDRELFRKAVGAVRPLPRNNHAAAHIHSAATVPATARTRRCRRRTVIRES